MIGRRSLLGATAGLLATPAILRAQTTQSLGFYYPIAVGGPIQAVIDGYCQDFKAQTGITVNPVYAGNYGETLTKAVSAIRAGQGPAMAVLLAAEMHSLQDMDILVPLDEIGLDADAQKWVDGFFPAFMANSHVDDKLWSIPFQRSTAVMYYNKQAFEAAKLDPEAFPKTWQQLADAAARLTAKDSSGRVTQWGVKVASDLGNAQWTFGAYAWQNNQKLMNEAGTEVYFNRPRTIEAMAYWQSLSAVYKATPPGITEWGTLSPDFFQGNAAIIQHTTGNLTNVRDKAPFKFGVAGLPGREGPRTVVGGGNMYFFKDASPAERKAALQFARFLSTPERAADWCIRTGYIATRPDAWATKSLTDHVAKFPEAGIAKSFLPVATGELSTFDNQRVQKALTDQIQACLNGTNTPGQSMQTAQEETTRLLRPFQRT